MTFQLRRGSESLPIAYAELASELGARIGDRVNTQEVRQAVLKLRSKKGMLEGEVASAGSFFTNPVLTQDEASKLPIDAPRWPQEDGRIKTSAAWLIERSGIEKGKTLGGAAISSLHVLALSNAGAASAKDIVELANFVRERVRENFGITLEAEVQLVGLELNS